MNTKQRKAKAYAKKECPTDARMREQSENDYTAGWDGCMEYLSKLPLDRAVDEILKFVESKK